MLEVDELEKFSVKIKSARTTFCFHSLNTVSDQYKKVLWKWTDSMRYFKAEND